MTLGLHKRLEFIIQVEDLKLGLGGSKLAICFGRRANRKGNKAVPPYALRVFPISVGETE
ncbi:hypothetical protein OUZ56_019404 [Daphnia magna]|uniref:Uncharacterized protein n=1 Tax=Daphnia magna TaxID=35525 RepID=A0ABQ9ZCJ1_9CRUS|nr:hypothetical protein OUZ56_019404 [Daphnia magna]